MENQQLYYQPSNEFHIAGFLLATLLATVASFFLGYLYTVLILFIPFIYLNFFVTLGFGLTLFYIVKISIWLTHNRSKKSQIALAVVTALAAYFFQWLPYVLYGVEGQIPSLNHYISNLPWLIQPQNTFPIIQEIHKIGMWEFYGIPLNGIILTIIWLIEFLMILAIPIGMTLNYKTSPYSESLGKWYPCYTLSEHFQAVSSASHMIEALQKDPFEAIMKLETGQDRIYTHIHLYYLEQAQKQYLSFEKIYIREGGKDQHTTVIEHFAIDRISAEQLLNHYKHRKMIALLANW